MDTVICSVDVSYSHIDKVRFQYRWYCSFDVVQFNLGSIQRYFYQPGSEYIYSSIKGL